VLRSRPCAQWLQPGVRSIRVGCHVTADMEIRRAGPTTREGTKAQPITTGHMTNYDGWNKFEEQEEEDEDAYELVEVCSRP
jgi:hypothetical protein